MVSLIEIANVAASLLPLTCSSTFANGVRSTVIIDIGVHMY